MKIWLPSFLRREQKDYSMVDGSRGGWMTVMESFTGAWQRNIVLSRTNQLAFHANFACATLIASDIAKLRVKLIAKKGGIWDETTNPAYTPVLRKPNRYQTRIQFWEAWILSKLNHGNAYILKEYDNRDVVVRLYVLDPQRVHPLVNEDDGSVFYQLDSDTLAGLNGKEVVPARFIIHDRFNCLFHPLCGLPPLFANSLAATQGINIQRNSVKLFANDSTPGGLLLAPGKIDKATADRLKEHWERNYSGENRGRVAVLGDNLKYEKMSLTAVEGQLIEQLKLTAEIVCSTYHVPPYKIGVGALPSYNNVQALNVEYYSQCLQVLIEAAELCLDEGLGLADDVGVEFDLDNLLRMDGVTQMDVLDKGKNVFTPNEARQRVNLPPVTGGDVVLRQQQDFSLEALAKRDAKDDPFKSNAPSPAPANDAAPSDGGSKSYTDEEITAAAVVADWKLRSLLKAA